jgi:hypothetical protein
MLRFEMIGNGTLDTLARCEHCGKIETFHTPSLWEAVDSDGDKKPNDLENLESAIRDALTVAGHDGEGCEV